MEHENLDPDAIFEARRAAIAASIREVRAEEMNAFGEKVFATIDHPWRQMFFDFVAENAASTHYHAVTHEGVHILYCRERERGIWFVPGTGKGPLQPRGLAILRDIVDDPQRRSRGD